MLNLRFPGVLIIPLLVILGLSSLGASHNYRWAEQTKYHIQPPFFVAHAPSPNPTHSQDKRLIPPEKAMRYLITLQLEPPNNSFEAARHLPGIREIKVDEEYGLILISPKRNLYVIRALEDIDTQALMSIQPAIKGIHGDPKIEPFRSE